LGGIQVGLATTRPTGISSNKRECYKSSVFTIPLKSYSCKIQGIRNEWTKKFFSDVDNLTEEKVDEVLKKFLEDFKEGSLESKGWPKTGGAYVLSKAAMNAYTRIVAKNYPTLCVNSICPGYVITDITANTGKLTAEEGAASVVQLALLPNGSPSGQFYYRTKLSSF
jgi:(+)-neomenthol dehydrogenase